VVRLAFHDDECEKKILPCGNAGCTENMERQKKSTSMFIPRVPCKYKGIGDKLHLHKTLDTVSVLQDTVRVLQPKNDNPVFMTFAVPDYLSTILHPSQWVYFMDVIICISKGFMNEK
jgi:hypothetical protein